MQARQGFTQWLHHTANLTSGKATALDKMAQGGQAQKYQMVGSCW